MIKDKAITMVFVAPSVNRNVLLSCPEISEEINDAWEEPKPGRKEDKGAIREHERRDFIL